MNPKRNPPSLPAQPIASVDNALTLLGMFGERESVRISEVSRQLGVAPSTASRLMSMLQFHSLVRRDEKTGAYVSGPRLIEIAFGALRRFDDRLQLHPQLERLSAELGETVHFVLLSGADAVFVDGVEGPKPVKTTLRLGFRRHAHCISAGKALLATLDAEQLRALYPDSKFPGYTEKSISDLPTLEADLALVRERGYATSIGESEIDVAAVAVPVYDGRDHAVGAIGVSVPMSRFGEDDIGRLLVPLREVAEHARVSVF